MSKAVRWQVPFANYSGTQYRIDIYDEGYSGNPVQLTAGATPFTTDEDSTENIFHPVRTQSGSLQVCTQLPLGGMLSLNDLLPDNNIARPVKMVRIDNSTTPATEIVEWQGFLSCETYSQDYVGVPQNITLSVISVLEAMSSVFLNQNTTYGLLPINTFVYQALNEIEVLTGMTFWQNIYYSATAWRFFLKYIDTSVFYNEEEVSNDNTPQYVSSGVSAKEALERICKYMGWVLREEGTNVYFERVMEEIGMYKDSMGNFRYDFSVNAQLIPNTSYALANCTWRGDGHKRSILQGSRSVKVVSSVEDYDAGLKMPGLPYGDLTPQKYKLLVPNYTGESDTYQIYTYFNKNLQAYANIEFGFHAATITWADDTSTPDIHDKYIDSVTYDGLSTRDAAMEDTIVWGSAFPMYKETRKSGAFFVAQASRTPSEPGASNPFVEGLYCGFIPNYIGLDYYPIFKMHSDKKFSFRKGKLKMSINVARIFAIINDELQGTDSGEISWNLFLCVGIGNKYTNGLEWYDTKQVGQYPMFGCNNLDYEFDIPDHLEGQISFEIMAYTYAYRNVVYDMLIESIEFSFETATTGLENDRSANNYYKLLNTNFRDDISVNVDFSSQMNNKPSPTVLLDSPAQTMERVGYEVAGSETPEMRRPEEDLLERLAAFYGSARQTLELDVAHPTAAPLPLLQMNGIDEDRVYLPISESRDWRDETSQLICSEISNEPPSES